MVGDIDFLTEGDFKKHVKQTISFYGEKFKSYDLKKFNSNFIDPIKLVFDKFVYGKPGQEIITSEIFRQKDKSNNNEIGYFHQNIFQYIKNCRVPKNIGDIVCNIPYSGKTTTIFVEMKNKHNTMNFSSSSKIYMKIQN